MYSIQISEFLRSEKLLVCGSMFLRPWEMARSRRSSDKVFFLGFGVNDLGIADIWKFSSASR